MPPKSKNETIWYLAYGSNLDAKRLESRIKRGNVEWKVARLDNHRLSFDKPAGDGSGYATIAWHQDDKIYGVIYALHENELTKLDTYEGVPMHYVRRTIDVITSEGDVIPGECYFAVNPSKGLLPKRKYLDRIITGAEAHNLPPHYIDRLKALTTFD